MEDIMRSINDMKAEGRKIMGEITDQKRAREKMYDIDTRTEKGRQDMLDLARKELTVLGRSEYFDKMIDTLDMNYDRFVEHEMQALSGRTPEGRKELAVLAGIERKEYGETERFRRMLDKGSITPQAFEYFDKNGELPGMKKSGVSFRGREEGRVPQEERERKAEQREMQQAREKMDAQRANAALESAYSAMKRGDTAHVQRILRENGMKQSDLSRYARQVSGEIHRDGSSVSFGSYESDKRFTTSELERDIAAGREIATKNRIKELEEIEKKKQAEEKAKAEAKKKAEEAKKKEEEDKKKK